MFTMHTSTGLVLALVIGLGGPALAVEGAPGRYTMTATDNGMLRLDTLTGAVSLCTGGAGNWVCRSVADDRLALENEIDRLSDENQAMRAEFAKREIEVPPQVKPQRDASGSWRPSDKKVEEFMMFFETIMRRFKKMAESMQDDVPEK